MSLGEILKRATKSAWNDALLWFGINILLATIPILFTYGVILGNTGSVILQEPISHGELSLFSISLLAAGVYVILTGMKISGSEKIQFRALREALDNINFPGIKLWYPAIFFEASIATYLFVTSFTLNTKLANYQEILNFRIIITIMLTLFCFATSFFITLVDSSINKNPPSASELFGSSDQQIQGELEKGDWRS
jgi:hypothetical protein